jgi:hypothetical protein
VSDIVKAQVQKDKEDAYYHFPAERFGNILDDLSPSNPRVEEILTTHVVGDRNGQRFRDADVSVLVKLFVQTAWEGSMLSLDAVLDLVVVLVCELDSPVNRVDESVSTFVDDAVKAVTDRNSEVMPFFEQAVMAPGAEGRSERLARFFLHEAGPDEDLMVYPVLFHAFSALKEGLALRVSLKEEL